MVRSRGSSARRCRRLGRLALLAAALLVGAEEPGVARAAPDDEPPAESIRGPWSGGVYRAVRDGTSKSFVGPDGARHATPREVVEADAAGVDPLRLVLTGDLADVARDASRTAVRLPVTILFRAQPMHDAGAAARFRHADAIAAAMRRTREILDGIAPQRIAGADRVDRGERRVRVRDVLDDEARLLTPEEREEMRRNQDVVASELAAWRREALAEATSAVDASQAAVRRFLETLPDARLHSRSVTLNALTASVPAGALLRLVHEFPEIARIDREGVAAPTLATSIGTIGADDWWNAGWTGSSTTPVVVLDTGIDSAHPALSGRVSASGVFHNQGRSFDSNYADSPTNGDDFHGHGTHVGGIVGSTDTTNRGVAYGAPLLNGKISYVDVNGNAWSWDGDLRDGGDWAATNGAAVMSHSFGGASSTTDGTDDRSLFFDAVCQSLAIPVAISAGNSGSGTSTITVPADAFNILSVANFSDAGSTSASDDSLASSSSRGPTSDGRRKPDIAAPGTNIRSCAHSWEGSGSDFVDFTGTSMAAPHVAGGMALLLDHGAAAYPEGLKALLLGSCAHTSPYNTSPDNAWGYGAMDLGRAFAFRASVAEATLDPSDEFVLLRGGALAAGGRVTLVWNRHVTSNGSSSVTTYHALTDLDLRVYDEGTNSQIGSSTSSVNPVEQAEVSSANAGPVFKVFRPGSLPSGVSTEPFAVAAESTGATQVVDPPTLVCSIPAFPAPLASAATFDVEVTVRNAGGLRAFAPSATLTLPTGYTLLSGANPRTLGDLDAAAATVVSWTVQAPTGPSGAATLRAQATTSSYGETFDSAVASVDVGLDAEPPTGTISAGDYASSTSVAVTLNASDVTTWVSGMRLRDAAADWGDWTSYAGTATVAVASGEGTRTLEAEFRDAAGNVSATASDSVVVDTVAPSVVLVVAGGAEFTNSTAVSIETVTTDASSGVRLMHFGNDGSNWRSWRAYASTANESLLAANGAQSLYVQVADAAGNVSPVVSDSIVLDTVAPTATAALLGGASYASPWSAFTADFAIDPDLSGVDAYRWRFDVATEWSAWQAYGANPAAVPLPAEASDRPLTVVFQVRDRAGNVSAPFSDAIHALASAPQDASRASTLRGTIAPGADFDAYALDLVAGQALTVQVSASAKARRVDLTVELDLYCPDGSLLVEGRHPAASRKAGIRKLPVLATGRHWLVVRATGADAAVGAKYTLTTSVKSPAAVLRPAGTVASLPDGRTEFAFDAAPGWKLSATFVPPASGTPTLVAPDGTEILLPALRKSGRAMRLAPTVLAGDAGTWRLLVPQAPTTQYSLALVPPRRGRVKETTGPEGRRP